MDKHAFYPPHKAINPTSKGPVVTFIINPCKNDFLKQPQIPQPLVPSIIG
jgi:hypothetical protein